MQPALSTPITQPPIPAWGELSEKPRLGFTSKNAAWNPGPNVCNSTVLLGFEAGLALNRVRSFCSGEQYDADLGLYYLRARYYNPIIGRFVGRDPENGKPFNPKTLHKYLYANGDPVNRLDRSGREGEEEEAGAEEESIEEVEAVEEIFKPNVQNLTNNAARAARRLNVSKAVLECVIHKIKAEGGFDNNPDVDIDITNGNIWLAGDFLGCIFEHIDPEE